jgi:hypothetical protein
MEGDCELYPSSSGHISEHSNQHLGCIKCWEFLEWLSNCWLLKQGSAPLVTAVAVPLFSSFYAKTDNPEFHSDIYEDVILHESRKVNQHNVHMIPKLLTVTSSQFMKALN